MIRKDFILRMIEDMVAVIHRLAGLKIEQNYEAALALLDETYPRLTGLTGELLRHAAPKTLLQLLSFAGEIEPARVVAAAELLKEEGDLRAELGRDDLAYACYDRALFLFVALIEQHGFMMLEGRLARIDAVADAIGLYTLPADVGLRLFSYYRLTHRYGDAEVWLFRALAATEDRTALQDGISFFEDLLRREDRELTDGGITRQEAEEGLAELRERWKR